MAVRNIIKIDENKCNGCGLCVSACAEGAIQIVNGKAKLISETYCDGLGACIGHCPQGAITIEQREAAAFDEKAVHEHLARLKNNPTHSKSNPADSAAKKDVDAPQGGFVCPGMRAMQFDRTAAPAPAAASSADRPSQLAQWPVQLHLVNPAAPYFAGAEIVLTADCVPFAMADFHEKILAGRAIAVACPKLDDTSPYLEKLVAIIQKNQPKKLIVAHMEVPCCSGLVRLAKQAIAASGLDVPFEDITVSLRGQILSRV